MREKRGAGSEGANLYRFDWKSHKSAICWHCTETCFLAKSQSRFRSPSISGKGNTVLSCPKFITNICFFALLPAIAVPGIAMGQSSSRGGPPIGAQRGVPGQHPQQDPRIAAMAEAKTVALPDDLAAVIAVVGESQILLGDVKPRVDAQLNHAMESSKQEIPKDYLHLARVNLTRGFLKQSIINKMKRESFILDQIGSQPADKRREANETMSSRARQVFYESEVPDLKERFKVSDMSELDDVLAKQGSSLAAREREFMDAMLGHMFTRSSIERNPKVTLAEINNYYQANRAKYAHKAQVKWEQLSVLFSKHPSRQEAKNLIWEMGREAYFGGNVQAVARARSEESFASSGGLHDWTNQGSLASKPLDTQLFSLPLNKMSQIIEDDNGYHIIRILGRKPAGVKSLAELQDEIEKEIQSQKIAKAEQAMVKKMQAMVPVWSIFPQDFPGAKPLQVKTAGVPDSNNYR